MSQLPLFEEAVEAVVDPSLAALAARLPRGLRLGTSSWSFPGWAGIVWRGRPSEETLARRGLAAYARWPLARTVGIDRSYYAPLTDGELAGYRAQMAPDLVAVAKVGRAITTAFVDGRPNPRFLDAEAALPEVAGFRAGLGPHAGPLVLEIAPSGGRLAEEALARALDRCLARLPPEGRYAVELRERALLGRRYLAVLRAHRAAHVFNAWTAMPRIADQLALVGEATAPFAVARLLLPPGARYQDRKRALAPFDRLAAPDPATRGDALALARRSVSDGRELFLLAGNKIEGCAPLTLRAIAEAW